MSLLLYVRLLMPHVFYSKSILNSCNKYMQMNFSQNSNETLNVSDVQKFVKYIKQRIFHDFDILANIAVIIVNESTLTKKPDIL